VSRWFQSYGFADVAPGLVVGAYPLDEADLAALQMLRIDRILNLTEDAEYPPGVREWLEDALLDAEIVEERLSLPDYGGLPPEAIDEAVTIVSGWLDEGRRCYVHCRAGWQRSAAIASAVIAVRDGITLLEALRLVQVRKPSANPLPHQKEDMVRWWRLHQDRLAAERGD
jgi:protein-tyrosine phosphatase